MNMDETAEIIKQYGSRADEELKKLLPEKGIEYLSEPVWHHMGTGGKRIRPALAILTCKALGGDEEKAMNYALAVEIMHNMLLLHDDIMDGDKVRRDQPTVWVKFGVPNAINAGDYMIAIGYEAILKSDLPKETINRLIDIYTLTLKKTVEGQALDVNLRADKDFTVEKYMKIAELKTGYYLVFALVGGAVIAGADDKVVEKIWKLGKNMGPAFQIRDDIIDLTEGKGRGGAIGNDIKEGKPSILFAHALKNSDEKEKAKLLEVMGKGREGATDEDVKWVIELFKKKKSIEFAQEYAEKLNREAYKVIEEIPLENKQVFRDIADFIINRKS